MPYELEGKKLNFGLVIGLLDAAAFRPLSLYHYLMKTTVLAFQGQEENLKKKKKTVIANWRQSLSLATSQKTLANRDNLSCHKS